MAITFNEELIRVEFVIGEDTIAETVSGELEVPALKPDIERVIDVQANLNNITTEIDEGVVNITGTVNAGIIYVADVAEPYLQQPVHFYEGTFQFTNAVDIPGAEPGMNVFTDLNIRRVSFQQLGPRLVEVTIVLTKFVKVTEFRQITVITDVSGIPEENIVEELLRIEDVIGENTVTAVITGRVVVPNTKPPIEQVLRAMADLTDIEAEITDEGVIVEGNVLAGVMYVGDVPEDLYQQPVHFVEGEFPFTEAIDVPGAEPGMTVHTNLTVRRVSFDFINDRVVEIDVVVQFFVKVTEPKQVTVVVDVISDQVEIERELLRVEDVIGEDTVHETFTGRLNIPAVKPDVERIIESQARVSEFTAEVEDGGVMIEGTIDSNVMYVADVPEGLLQQPVHFVEGPFDFENFIDIAGAEDGMNVHSTVEVTRSTAEIINARTIEVTVVLRKFAKVTEFRQLDIVTELVVVSPVTEDECPPSYVIYVVQPGDTLWKIARRYNTTVDALINANPGIDPNNLQIGQKICVPSGIIKPKG